MIKCLFFVLAYSLSIFQVFGQGCADAGFCSIGAMQNASDKEFGNNVRNTIGISSAVGNGEKLSWIISPQLELKIAGGKKSYFEAKLPYQVISGNLGTNKGIGDLFIAFTSGLKINNERLKLQYTIGTRIGLHDASDKIADKPLPMAYQVSTGTTDLILGLGAHWGKHLVIATGIQQPVIQYNRNGYYTSENRDSVATAYFSSLNLRRKGDVLLRIDVKKDWKNTGITGGSLFLYHLGEDISLLNDGTKITLSGSQGFTVNINCSFYYRFENWLFDIVLAAPIHARENRPDGLTRNAVVIPRLTFML